MFLEVILCRIRISVMICSSHLDKSHVLENLRVIFFTWLDPSMWTLIIFSSFSSFANDLAPLLQSLSIYGLFLGVQSTDRLFHFQRTWVSWLQLMFYTEKRNLLIFRSEQWFQTCSECHQTLSSHVCARNHSSHYWFHQRWLDCTDDSSKEQHSNPPVTSSFHLF